MPIRTARINEVCDAVVQRIKQAWGPISPDDIERAYAIPLQLDKIAGRRLYVFPAKYASLEPANRGEDLREYTVPMLAVERFTDAGLPDRDWLDERVNWVEEMIWQLCENPRDATPLLGTLWPQTSDVDTYDPEMLNQKKCFWSEIEIVFREVAAPDV